MKHSYNLDMLRAFDAADYVTLLIEQPDTPVIADGTATLAELREALAVRKALALHLASKAKATRHGFDDSKAAYPLAKIALAHHSVERSTMALREVLDAPHWRNLAPLHAGGKIAVALMSDMLDLVDAAIVSCLRWEEPLPVPIWAEDIRDMVVDRLVEHGHLEPIFPEGAAG